MKKFFTVFLIIILFTGNIRTSAFSINDSEVKRYTVLVLDTSGTANFIGSTGRTIYTADTAVNHVKKAADKFVRDILKANGENYIAVVSYKDKAIKVIDFTSDNDILKQKINDLSASSTTRDISDGLREANELLSTINGDNIIKNVVLVTTGMTNEGQHNYTGHYGERTIGSNWRRTDTNIRLYAYANVALEQAEIIKKDANLYTLGIFQTMEGMPEEGKSIADFFRLTALDLASSTDYFYDIDDPEKIDFVFGEIVDDITMIDSDGDGLYDDWEINGIDIERDGTIDLHLEKMGADPNVPDIFIEVDWMVQPSENVLFIKTQQELSLAPPAEAMRMVYEAFKKHNINLHIDVGPDSTDFVTGKKWGSLSGGNEIPYQANIELGENYENWNYLVENNFDVEKRSMAFKHALFINEFGGTSISGISCGIPAQYFIVANQKWLRDTGNTGIAGTFMHELGHTLGLSHGGHMIDGTNNHLLYKPNYLSIMNYLFQTSGLAGTNEVNYSEYTLPSLDENSLSESAGVDPNGITKGSGLGTKIKNGSFFIFDKTIVPIANQSIDFNNTLSIDNKNIKLDLNDDNEKTLLTSSKDWEHLIFNGGAIGKRSQMINIAGIDKSASKEEMLKEPDLNERLSTGLLANEGAGAIEVIGPFTLLKGYNNQKVIVRVKNLSSKDTTFKLIVEGNKLIDDFEKEITVEGTTSEISYVDVDIKTRRRPKEGKYNTRFILKSNGHSDVENTVAIEVYNPTEEELNTFAALLNESETEFPEHLKNIYLQTLSEPNHQGLLEIIMDFFDYIIQSINQLVTETEEYIKSFFDSIFEFSEAFFLKIEKIFSN